MKKVLIINDEKDKINSLRSYFESKNFIVKATENVNDTMKILFEELFDILILDMELPQDERSNPISTGGLDIVNFLYINDYDIPFIVFTQYGDYTDSKKEKVSESKYYKPQIQTTCIYQDVNNIEELNSYLSRLNNKYLGAVLYSNYDDYWINGLDVLLQEL